MLSVFESLSVGLVVPAPDPRVKTIAIAGTQQQQQLPLSLCSSWPVWVCLAGENALSVTQVPGTTSRAAARSDQPTSWVDPRTFEQLWLPEDLAAPEAWASVGIVLKDGAPRYLFPTAELLSTTTAGAETLAWHNRGMNSFAIGRRWLSWDAVPFDRLQLSAYMTRLPLPAAAAGAPAAEPSRAGWTTLLPLTPVKRAVETLFKVLADAPPDVADGYVFLLCRLPGQPPLPPPAIAPGARLRLVLSDGFAADAAPMDGAWEMSDAWGSIDAAECELDAYAVPAGTESEWMPDVYRPLFDASSGRELER
jgi:hypothetical protein